jgi:hypothetical protein
MMPSGPKGLLNLSHVTFIVNMDSTDNIAEVPPTGNTQAPSYFQIDAADMPK